MLNLVTVVGTNTHLLPHMLKYYEDKVDKMYVCVYKQDQNDTIEKQVRDLGIKPFMIFTEPKYNWDRVTEIYNSVKQTKPNDWWLIADDDEFHAYPYDIEDIIKDCEESNHTFVTGGFLDRIGENGNFPEVNIDTDIFKAFPYAGYFRYPMSGACPNKVTLAKGSQKITSGQHYAYFDENRNSWGRHHPKRMPIKKVFTQVHHFKWDSSCVDRVKDVSETKEEYTYWWEYKKLYDAIKENNFKIDINKSEYNIVKMKNSSYIDYNDYPHWDLLTEKIIKI